MLDKLTAAVLAAVNELAGGAYKVIEAKELADVLPAKYKAYERGLCDALKYLGARGYVDIRYEDGGTFCLRSLPKGRAYTERGEEEKKERRTKGGLLALFFGSFAGGALGALVTGLLLAFLL